MAGFAVTEDVAFSCCASRVFARKLAAIGKYEEFADLVAAARHIWWSETSVPEWLAAFAAHPKIGDAKAVETNPGAFAEFSRGEQAAAAQTSTVEVAEELQLWNTRYAEKFGHIFIIFARGRSAPEILAALKERYNRMPHEELQTAAQEQMKITELRLGNVFGVSAEQEMLAKMQRRADRVSSQVNKGFVLACLLQNNQCCQQCCCSGFCCRFSAKSSQCTPVAHCGLPSQPTCWILP
jgi:5-hydroxyisourate hydrolase/2-oxo-4-hydroxy-4-carboxy-5-ureidoimidazoline decarboxylase